MCEPPRGEFRGGPREPSSVVLAGRAKREERPATVNGAKAGTEPLPYMWSAAYLHRSHIGLKLSCHLMQKLIRIRWPPFKRWI